MHTVLDVIIIGAGHAGLSASYYLKQHDLDHVVLERAAIGESWISQRWGSFRLNTSNKLNTLPMMETSNGDDFSSAGYLAKSMYQFATTHSLPVETGVTVTKVTKDGPSGSFNVVALHNNTTRTYNCRHLIVASGTQNKKRTSPLSSLVDPGIHQIHSSEYKNPGRLPAGNILVVGSGQSGCQIAEELADVGRQVYLSTSFVPGCPRYYRGKDIMDWLILAGFFDVRPDQVPDPALLDIRTPLLKGTGGGKQDLSLQGLAKQGVVLLGNMKDVSRGTAQFSKDMEAKLAFADAFSTRVKTMIDDFIKDQQISAPQPIQEFEGQTLSIADLAPALSSVHLKQHHISSIIWANGFTHDLSYLQLPAFDVKGQLIHKEGISCVEGLYFLGLRWQRTRKSETLFGITDDAQFISNQVYSSAKRNWAEKTGIAPRPISVYGDVPAATH